MELPVEWVKRSNFLMKQARRNLEEGAHWFVCFEVHQAVEFYLKAFSLAIVGVYPYTHDLVELLEFIKDAGISPPQELYAYADALTPHYTLARYPGREPINYDRELGERCLSYGEKIIEWIKKASSEIKG